MARSTKSTNDNTEQPQARKDERDARGQMLAPYAHASIPDLLSNTGASIRPHFADEIFGDSQAEAVFMNNDETQIFSGNSTIKQHSSPAPTFLTTCLVLLLLIAVTSGCYRAPKRTGADQVLDLNYEATLLKDNGLSALVWPEVDNYVWSKLSGPNNPGCAVGIARDDELIYLKGYGKAEIGGDNWTVGTVGAVGSISKTITAAAALRMHELDLINVNNNVSAYLASSNGAINTTRVGELLNHTSGVGGTKAGYPNWENGSPADDCLVIGPDEAISCANSSQFAASPMNAFSMYESSENVTNLPKNDPPENPHDGIYSNVGYSVAGAVIDHAAFWFTPSDGYESWIWDNVGIHNPNLLASENLLTLALTHSWRDNDIPNRAVGYTPNGGAFDVYEAFDPGSVKFEGWEGPAGGWAMTIGDLTRFTVELNTGKIVGGSMLNAMRHNWTDLDGSADNYGMGMFLNKDGNNAPYWHGGNIGGHSASWGWWDDYNNTGESLAVTVMCNIEKLSTPGWSIPIAQATRGTAPRIAQFTGLAPVQEREIVDTTFALDFSVAWQAKPASVILPPALSQTLLIETKSTLRGMEATLREGKVVESVAKPDPKRKEQSLGELDIGRNPSFESRTNSARLETKGGELVVEDLKIFGRFAQHGKAMSDMSVGWTLDSRQAKSLGVDWQDMCRAADASSKTEASPCQPCKDGVEACVSVRYDGVRADHVRTAEQHRSW